MKLPSQPKKPRNVVREMQWEEDNPLKRNFVIHEDLEKIYQATIAPGGKPKYLWMDCEECGEIIEVSRTSAIGHLTDCPLNREK